MVDPNSTYSFGFNGNPDVPWDALNEENDHYLRFITRDGLHEFGTTLSCFPNQHYVDYNEYSEAVKVSSAGSGVEDNQPPLVQN